LTRTSIPALMARITKRRKMSRQGMLPGPKIRTDPG
jgi:hypothetical protein